LRSPCYCHFTSPIRRYPDLVCHRALLSTLESAERAPRPGELAELGAWCSEQERGAMTIERDGDDVASCFALERVLYEGGFEQTFAGEVVGLIGAGAFIAFGPAAVGDSDEPPAGSQATQDARGMHVYEGMLPVRRLRGAPGSESAGAWWELNELGTILRSERTGGALRLGDELAVQVVRIDAPRGRVELMPVPAERG
jgi:ribonuclease R